MNEFHAKAVFRDGAWRGEVRYCHRAGYRPLMDGTRQAAFATKQDAEIAALRAQERHINGTLRRDGAVIEARSKAEALFKAVEHRRAGR